MGYFSVNTPVNATKICAKIMGTLVNGNPACMSRVLPLLLDNDVVALNCSHDKLAFRLRLAGGALHFCQGASDCLDSLVLPLVLSVVGNPALVGHAEKDVRKATCKLVNKLLKGLTSFYPTGTQPFSRQDGSGFISGSCVDSGLQVGSLERPTSGWYTPTPNALSAGARVLRATVLQPMQALVSLLTALVASSNTAVGLGDGGGLVSVKKADEALVQGLKMIQKSLKGAAEVLGDEHTPGALIVLPVTPGGAEHDHRANEGGYEGDNGRSGEMLFQPDGSDDQDEAGKRDTSNKDRRHVEPHVMSTGRNEVLQLLADSSLPNSQIDRELYLTLRFAVMDFLVFAEVPYNLSILPYCQRVACLQTNLMCFSLVYVVKDALMYLAKGVNSDSSTTRAVTPTVLSGGDTSTTVAGRPYASLADSTGTRAAWAKTFTILIAFRVAHLKEVNVLRVWYTSTKQATRSLLMKTMIKRCRMTARDTTMTALPTALPTGVASLDYWLGNYLLPFLLPFNRFI